MSTRLLDKMPLVSTNYNEYGTGGHAGDYDTNSRELNVHVLTNDENVGNESGQDWIGLQSWHRDSFVPDRQTELIVEDDTLRRSTRAPDRISHWQAGWNVTNAIQGMFVVSLPYTVLHGGWWGVFVLIFVAYICYYTGILLVECLYDNQGRRILDSYKAVAEECWGRPWGGRLVLGAQMIELLMTCILYIVLCGDLMESSFPNFAIDKMGWMLISTALLLPCAFLRDLRAVSWLSFWNTVSHLHLEGSMADRSKFRTMLKYSHVAAALFKSLFGLVGFLTFGRYTQDEVTNNLPSQSFKALLNVILVIKALLSYPLPYYASVDLLQRQFFYEEEQKSGMKTSKNAWSCFWSDGSIREWALASRLCLVLFTLFMAISVPHFALLMGLVGNVTGTMLSFVWPSLFHLRIKGASMSQRQRTVSWSIVGSGLVFGTIGIYYSSLQLHKAINAVDGYG